MRHIQITHSAEPSVIGVKNGVSQLDIDVESLNLVSPFVIDSTVANFLINQYSIPKLNLGGIKGQLLKKAKITDIMVFSPFMFGFEYIVSEKFVSCLIEANVSQDDYTLFPIELKDVNQRFYLFFVPMIPVSEVDFSKSLLYPNIQILDDDKTYLNVNSYEEYCKLNETNPLNSFEKMTLPGKYKKKEVLSVQGASRIFLSESLIDLLKSNEISNLIVPERQVLLEFGD